MKKKILWGMVLAALVVVFVILLPFVRLVAAASRNGFFDKTEQRSYNPNRRSNLEAIKTALELMYESDGQYPQGKDWMDQLFKRLKTADMTEDSAKLKLHRPDVEAGGFGYALNRVVMGKSKSDLGDASKVVVVFESKKTGWNELGEPASDGLKGGQALMADGSIRAL